MPTAGSEQPLTLAELDAMLADGRRFEERRSQLRVEYRNRAQVICVRTDSPTVRSDASLVWTDDVSVAGVNLLLSDSFSANRFWIRFPGNVLQDPFIECRVKWRGNTPANAMSGPSEALHRCGAQFQRQLSREEFERLLAGGRGAH